MPFEELLDQEDELNDDSEFSGFNDNSPFENFTEEELESAGVKLLSKEDESEDAPMFSFEIKNAEEEAKRDQPKINIANILDPSRFVKSTDPNPDLFSELYSYTEELTEDDKKQLAFKDYFEAPKLSGNLTGLAQSNIIPQDKVEFGEKRVFIEDEKLSEKEQSKPATVVLHKNEIGEVETIEVICACGRSTAISLVFKDDSEHFEFEINSHEHNDENDIAHHTEESE